jgi:SEC-C motif
MDDELYDDDNEEAAEEIADFFRNAVVEALRTEDSTAFLEWVREEAPERAPELFEDLPDEQARRGVAAELGRTIWNGIPLPGNGFRPQPIARPERNDPCPCGSGTKYKKCCGEWAGSVPALDPELLWVFVVQELPLERVEELGQSGRVPRPIAGEIATGLLDEGDAERALALVQPLFERPDRLDERDGAALSVLLEAHDDLDLYEEKQELVDRLSKQLKPLLRAVLWEHLVRWHALEGEMEEAWEALEKARKDDPQSAALGPLEVSLLLAEGRTDEAGERARFFRERFRRNPGDLSEAGLEFLDKVAHDPEGAQLEFSIGKGVSAQVRELEALLAEAKPPENVYGIEDVEGDPGAGRLVPPESLTELDLGWEAAFFEAAPEDFLDEDEEYDDEDEDELLEEEDEEIPEDLEDEDDEDDEEDEDEEDLDPWDEERAERWLGYLLENPESLDSLETLEDLAHAVHGLVVDRFTFLDRPVLRPILDRGLAILRQSLAARPEITRLPEELEPNGSALELISLAAAQASRANEPERVRELLKWLKGLEPRVVEEEADA